MERLVSDVRFAARALANRPAFTLVAVLTLALGIGANSAIFSVVDALLLRPLPYRDPGRLVWVENTLHLMGMSFTAGADYLEWRDASRSLAAVAAFSDEHFTLTDGESPERVAGAMVSASFLPALGVAPARGRAFGPGDEKLNAAPVALVSDRLWRRLFGTGAALAGQGLRIDGRQSEVVGVLPRDFVFPGNPDVDVLVPLALNEARERSRRQMVLVSVIGRLASGFTLGQARAELKAIHTRSVEAARQRNPGPEGSEPGPGPDGGPPAGPGGPGGGRMQVHLAGPGPGGPPGGRAPGGPGRPGGSFMPESELQVTFLSEHLVGNVRPALLLLLAAVGLVLLIACANVANLLLARAAARRREMAVRAALGAGRRRIARQLLTESALLGLLGGLCGLGLAFGGIRLLVALMPADFWGGLLRQVPLRLDAPVLAFTLLLSLATGLLFGLAPALAASRVDLTEPLKEGERRRPGRARGLLVVAEVALSVVLLVLAGLLLRSFLTLRSVDPGFAAGRVLSLTVELPRHAYESPARQLGYYKGVAQRLAALPGVESAAFSDAIPLEGPTMMMRGLSIEGREPLPPEKSPEVWVIGASPGYFGTMGIPVLRGRALTAADIHAGAPVAVVSREMARRFWDTDDAVGRRLRVGPPGAPWTTVVGIARDVHQEGLDKAPRAQMYRPFDLAPREAGFFLVRAKGDPAALTAAAREAVLAADRTVLVHDVTVLERRLAGSVAARRFNLLLLALLSGLALTLAAVGLYGVLGYIVAERTREIGVRMALGAERRRVLSLVIRQGLTLAAVGIGVGLPGAFAASRLLRGSLFGVTAADPLTYVAIPLALLLVALLSSWLPARRATHVDPVVALRNDPV
ncbi:MAG TPA: ABC transporter permease [Thermoanaerobaculia bacterium]|nr:ABC transporter permease [Thermoanaerobaculia bacterium]